MQIPIFHKSIEKITQTTAELMLELLGQSPSFETDMLLKNRLPMESVALVRMQTPPQLSSRVIGRTQLDNSF